MILIMLLGVRVLSEKSTRDERLYVKEFVVGVEINGDPVAFPFSVLNAEPVVNQVVGGRLSWWFSMPILGPV